MVWETLDPTKGQSMKSSHFATRSVLIMGAMVVLAPSVSAQNVGPGRPQYQKIVETADASSCARQSWNDRGRAPAGYVEGMALTYARTLCRMRSSGTSKIPATIMSEPLGRSSSKDALLHYRSIFNQRGVRVDGTDAETLRALYTLGLGLGMRESSGKYCEGWDRTASSVSANTAEAGLFQTSYDSLNTTPDLRLLYNEYLENPDRCLLDVFKKGATCRARSVYGRGAGADYQKFNKACPAFATEYALILLRRKRRHFGPINRQEAEVRSVCNAMFARVETTVRDNPEICGELL